MKKPLLLVLLLIGLTGFAQDSTMVTALTHKLHLGKAVSIENIRLEFKNLSPDSRCPKEVMCIRAGEAIATLKVSINNKIAEETELTFFPNGVIEELSKLLEGENILIRNLELLPYSNVGTTNLKTKYFIQFETLIKS